MGGVKMFTDLEPATERQSHADHRSKRFFVLADLLLRSHFYFGSPSERHCAHWSWDRSRCEILSPHPRRALLPLPAAATDRVAAAQIVSRYRDDPTAYTTTLPHCASVRRALAASNHAQPTVDVVGFGFPIAPAAAHSRAGSFCFGSSTNRTSFPGG